MHFPGCTGSGTMQRFVGLGVGVGCCEVVDDDGGVGVGVLLCVEGGCELECVDVGRVEVGCGAGAGLPADEDVGRLGFSADVDVAS